MKFLSILLLFSCLFPVSAEMVLAENGKAKCRIITAETLTRPSTETLAELKEHLTRMTGAVFETVRESELPSSEDGIYYGDTAFARSHGIDVKKLGREEWVIRSVGNSLVIAGGEPRGTMYGALHFLEKYLGCRWFDYDCIVVPFRNTLRIGGINDQFRPAIPIRIEHISPDIPFWLKTRNMETVGKYGDNFGNPGRCHTSGEYSGNWTDMEMFALQPNGNRSRGQICLTNPKARKAVAEQMIRYIEVDRSGKGRWFPPGVPPGIIYDISQNDARSECYCPGCKAIFEREGSYSGPNVDFVNAVAAEVGKVHPEKLVSTYAYSYTLIPPKNLKCADNVIIQLCTGSVPNPLTSPENRKLLEKWRSIVKHLGIWVYWKEYQPYEYPYTQLNSLQKEIQLCRDAEVMCFFSDDTGPDVYRQPFYAVTRWMTQKLLVNPDLDSDKLFDDFAGHYYGKAAPLLKKYKDFIIQRQIIVPGGGIGPYRESLSMLNLDFFTAADKILRDAEELTKNDPRANLHVRRERIPFDEALLNRWKILGQNIPFDREAVIARYRQNCREVYDSMFNPKNKDSRIKQMEMRIKGFRTNPPPLPKIFEGADVIDMLWNAFDPWGFRYETDTFEDPEAAGGVAWRQPDTLKRLDAKKYNRPIHGYPVVFGFYDTGSQGNRGNVSLAENEVPKDEKYHLYKVGTMQLSPNAYLWFHWSSVSQIWLRGVLTGIYLPKVDVYASIKIMGPSYVNGSGKEDYILVDRVILVKHPENEKVPLRPELTPDGFVRIPNQIPAGFIDWNKPRKLNVRNADGKMIGTLDIPLSTMVIQKIELPEAVRKLSPASVEFEGALSQDYSRPPAVRAYNGHAEGSVVKTEENNALKLNVVDYYKDRTGKNHIDCNLYLCVSKDTAFPVSPDTTYRIFLALKGSAKRVWIQANLINEKEGKLVKERYLIQSALPAGAPVKLTSDWQDFYGIFKTGRNTKSAEVSINLWGDEKNMAEKPGDYVLIRDISITP
ncbi:MAG: hypothetical protein BWY31_00071 [Lentisphaerae bacterium ADurb.Bin242]|nr:MAG: hypothetical protein BWY31_00071 [Lentisphaerae bacterium ADurb.Bin242]